MRVRRQNNAVVLTLNSFESRVLLRALRVLIDRYRLGPADLDDKLASAWYSTRGCASAQMSADETRDWLEHLHVIRGARLQHLERWAALLSDPKLDLYELLIASGEEDVFLTSLNDYRLLLAAQHDIGEHEMDRHQIEELEDLPAAQRTALFEIHFHAVVLELLISEFQQGQ